MIVGNAAAVHRVRHEQASPARPAIPTTRWAPVLIGTGAGVVPGLPVRIVLDAAAHARRGHCDRVLVRALSALFVMQFFLKKDSPMPLRRPSIALDPRIALRICALGIAPCVMELGFAVSSMIENNLLVLYGASDALGVDGALAVMRVLSAVGLFTFMPAMGISMGAQPIIGYNYGARTFGRMKRVLVQAIVLGIAITTPLWATVILAPDMYAHLFGLPEQYMGETA